MPEVHTGPTWNKPGFLGAKTSIPMSVQDCSCLPGLRKSYANITSRYLGWLKSLDHLLMLIDWEEQQLCETQVSWAGNLLRLCRATVNKIKACLRILGAGEGHACLSFRSGSSDPTGAPWSGKFDSDRAILLTEFSAKTRRRSCCKSCKNCLCETKQGLHALVLTWHGPPPQALAGERDPCQLQNRGYNTFLQETQDGSWLLLAATWMGPGLWHTSTLHFSFWPTPDSFLLRKPILKLFPKQWSWIMLCRSQLHTEPRGVRGAAFHAVSQG